MTRNVFIGGGKALGVLALAGLLALVSAAVEPLRADAGGVLLRARGMEDPPSALAPRNEKTGTAHKYVQVDFLGTGSETCTVGHFTPFGDYGEEAPMSVKLRVVTGGTSTNGSRWRVDVGCVGQPGILATCTGAGTPRACCTGVGTGNCNNYNTITLSPGTTFSFAPSIVGIGANVSQNEMYAPPVNTTGCSWTTPVIIKICRDPADSLDQNTDTLSLIDAEVTW